jgi:MFS family permease
VTDLFDPMSRGIPMSFFATASFSGGLGQLVSGYIVASTSWRWIYWHQLIINGILNLAIAIFFKETRGPVLLSRKAKALNTITAVSNGIPSATSKSLATSTSKSFADFTPSLTTQTHWRVESDEQRATVSQMIKLSLTRPFCKFISFRK